MQDNNIYSKNSSFSFSDLTQEKGAVTVFMTLCLLPILLMTTFFLDATRVNLAAAHINSIQQLMLNDVLVHNDKWLEQNYGLYGVSQQFGAKRLVTTEDINKSFIERLNKNITQNFPVEDCQGDVNCVPDNSSHYVSFLHVEPSISPEDSILSNIENANLSNMIVMEQQIIDN
ncbi:MAG: hypothetical protein LBN03_01340, partial [Bifidobacteriaceae bacterium]|nr:hypothetical protein [Bifidobacteriaceae bacterium]